MREVFVSDTVRKKISDLRLFLVIELKLSEAAAFKRIERIRVFLASLGSPGDFSLCRFKKWHSLGYRCAVFEKNWVFAYEIIDGGVIVRDMSNVALLTE